MLDDNEKNEVLRTWKLVVPIAETAADLFYKRLFELKPQYRSYFEEDMAAQKRKLLRMLAFIVRSLEWTDSQWRDNVNPEEDLVLVVLALGRRHHELYKIPDESYGAVGEALLWTLGYGLGDAFSPTVEAAWTKIYGLLTTTMLMGKHSIGNGLGTHVPEVEPIGEQVFLEDLADAGIDDARLGIEGGAS